MSDTTYLLGAQGPGSDVTAPNVLEFVVNRLMNKRCHVELASVVSCSNTPGKIGAVGTVNVQPLVNQLDGFGNAVPHGVVYGLSYFRYAGGQNGIVLDPQPGDIGLVVVADRDPSVVKSTGQQSNPGSLGRSRREYGIYIGLCQGNANLSRYISFSNSGITIEAKNGSTVTMFADGDISISSNGDVTIAAGGPDGVTVDANLRVIGAITATGEITAQHGTGNDVGLSTHTQQDGGGTGPSGPPTPDS